MVPGLAQETTLPFMSVIVISVLLNEDLMWAIPATSTFFAFFFLPTFFVGFAKIFLLYLSR